MAALLAKRAAAPAGNGDNPGKRARTEPVSFDDLLEECGCRVSAQGTAFEYVTEDPRKMRRALEQRLTLAEAQRRSFLDDVRSHLDPPEALHAALKPMTVTGSAALFTGDSFVRALLNIPPLQKDLSEYLLHRIPEFSDGDGAGTTAAAAATTAQLILGQFRWLDCLSDPHGVTALLLEVLPVMPAEARRDAVTFLPEIAPEEDHPAVRAALEAVVADAPEFLIPALEAAASLALSDEEQAGVAAMAAGRLQSIDVTDLPAAVRHLLQAAGGATDTLTPVRDALHFVDLGDPRLAVKDHRGKGRVPAPGEDPESKTLAAMRQALQFGRGASDAMLKKVKGVTDPAQHRVFDFWALLATAAAGPDRRRTVLTLLRNKFADGHAEPGWLVRSVTGHSVALTEQFPVLLGAAQALLSDGAPGAATAGAALFEALFAEFSEAYYRQEVLRALHSHLGAPAAGEATAALGVLRRLALERTADLLAYAAFLTNILDYVTRYSADQLTAAFDVFAELVAGACRAGASTAGAAASQGGGRSRMEDELFIFLRKQLSGAFPAHRRVGAVGVVALVRRLGAAMEEEGGAAAGGSSLLAQRYREANALLESTFNAAASCPDTLAFLCDALAAEARRGALPATLMRAMTDKLGAALEGQFIVEGPEWAAVPGREAWWNLAGQEFDHVVVALLPAATGAPAGPTSRGPSAAAIPTLFPMMRAVSSLNTALYGNLQAVDALLGAPLGLFPPGDAAPTRYAALDVAGKCQVLLGLFYALNWCRELVNAFAGEAAGRGGDGVADDRMRAQMQMSLMLRVRAAAQLEAALAALLPGAPPLTSLPCLGATPPVAAAAVPAKKPAAKKKGAKAGAAAEGTSGGTAGAAGDGDAQTGDAALAAALAAKHIGLVLPPAERSKLRPLVPSSLAALAAAAAVQGPRGVCLSSLPAAAYLLDDAVQKARLSLAAPKKAAPFLVARGIVATAAAIPPAELLAALCPVLPAVRDHLDAANRALESRLSDADVASEEESVLADACVGTAPSRLLGSLPGCPAARRAASPSASASRVFASGLECVRLLLGHHDIATPERLPALQAVLAAFGPKATGSSGGDGAQVWAPVQFVVGTVAAFKYFLGLAPSPGEGGNEAEEPSAAEMERWPAVLAVLEALVKVGERLAAAGGEPRLVASWAKKLALMRKKVSESAHFMLMHRWPASDADNDGIDDDSGWEPPAGGWKGRGPALSEAVRLSIVYAEDPLARLESNVRDGLLLLPTVSVGKNNSEPLDDVPSMSGVTMGVWYRVMWDVLQARWREVAAAARSSEKAGAAAAPEAVATIAKGAAACCVAFNHLVSVVKTHDRRAVVLNAAAKGSAAFIEAVLRVVPFWRENFASHPKEVIISVKAVQKACRTLNHLCAEGKVRGDMNVVSRVSRLKKAIEAFVNDSLLLIRVVAPEMVETFGELKHRDLQGNVLPTSQMFPGNEDEEDGGGGGGEEEEEAEEEEEEEQDDEEEREY